MKYNLAKVGVAGSNPVSRSTKKAFMNHKGLFLFK